MVTAITDEKQYDLIWQREHLSFLQSWQWGEVKGGSSEVVRLLIDDVVVTVFVKKLHFLPWQFGYIPRPFSDTTLSKSRLTDLLDYLQNKLHLTHIVVDPNYLSKNSDGMLSYKYAGFLPAGITIQPNQTSIIDLNFTEDEMFAKMTSTYRKKIRRAEKHGCTTEIVNTGDSSVVDRFYPIIEDIYRRTDYIMFGKNYFKDIWDCYVGSGRVAIVFVRYQGRDIGALFYVNSSDTANELYGGVVAEGLSLQANYLLKWAGIRYAKSKGLSFYDMWGVGRLVRDEYLPNDPLYNISLFKKDFGGIYVEYPPQQIKVFGRIPYLLYRFGVLGHRQLLRLTKQLRRVRRHLWTNNLLANYD